MTKALTEDQRKALSEAFQHLDFEGRGLISVEKVRTALQLAGHVPTLEDMEACLAKVEMTRELSQNELYDLVEEHFPLKTPDKLQQEMLDAFSTFDSIKDGLISCEEFRTVMTSRGTEPLTDEQADILLSKCRVYSGGYLNISDMVAMFST